MGEDCFGMCLSLFNVILHLPHTAHFLAHTDDLLCLQLHKVGYQVLGGIF